MRTQRAYAVWLGRQDIVSLFHNWRVPGQVSMVTLADCVDPMTGNRFEMPIDAVVEDATFCWERNAIGLRVTHPSFPETAEGDMIPSLRLAHVVVESIPARQDTADGPIVVGCG